MYNHISKKGINTYISTYKSQCFNEIYDFMLGRTHCSAGPHVARGPRVVQPFFSGSNVEKEKVEEIQKIISNRIQFDNQNI